VTSIISEVDRLTEITETYLRFARLPRPKLEREDLGAIVTGVLEFSRAELSQAGITLTIDVAEGLPEVAADEAQLRQALLNLVRNAREAMAQGGRLEVIVAARTAGDGAGQVVVTVADSGPGIAAAHLGQIFDPFFSTKERGTGLGLALVHQIVVEHGGRVDVDSGAGKGTRFALAFPAIRAEEEAASPATPAAEPRAPGPEPALPQGAPAAR
jgi:signal transduction histidine kinase